MPRFFGQADGIRFKQAGRLELCGVALRAANKLLREKRADKAPARYMERKLYKKEMRIDLKKTYIFI